jgi:ribosomal protein S18 acetylase RimI-like enzyme
MRRYRRDDFERVAELHVVALRDAGLDVQPGAWDTDLATSETLAATYRQPDGDFLVGEVDGAIVAMGALRRFDETRAEMKRVRVDTAYQRRGFGRGIVAALEARAVELGYRAMHLDTTTMQVAAIAMYEELGYEEIGRGDIGRFELVLMEKRLSG